jgi:outer membrane lipoprotein LolB
MEWKQLGTYYTIYLDGPLGQAIAKIEGKPEGVQLEASGERYKGQNPEQLLFELTGWDFPVSLLRYWVMGMPSPAGESTLKLNNQGNPLLINQQGWTVEYLQYKDFSGITMPSRMKIRQGEVQATLVARSWQLK